MERRRSRRSSLEVDPKVIATLDPDLVPFMHRPLERRYQMEDPVIAKDGHTYERRAIVEWLNKKKTSPLTHEPLDATALVPQHVVRKLIESFREKRRRR